MPFNVGGFNKVLSRAGVQTMGAVPRINRKLETSAAAQGLRNKAKIRAAEYGAQIMADRASAERSAARGNAIFGAIGNVLGSGLSAGIGNMYAQQNYLNDRYGSPSFTPYDGPLPDSTSGWAKPPPLPPITGASSGGSGSNPFWNNPFGKGW